MSTSLWPRVAALTGQRVRATRKELGLSQEQFATLVGKRARVGSQRPSVFTVSRWERDAKSPGMLWGPALLTLVEESEARRATQGTGASATH